MADSTPSTARAHPHAGRPARTAAWPTSSEPGSAPLSHHRSVRRGSGGRVFSDAFDLHLVLAVLLCAVERAVSCLEQYPDLEVGGRGDPRARRDPVRTCAAVPELPVGDGGHEALGGLPLAGA